MVKSTISAYGQGLIAENDRGAETGITFTFTGFIAGVGFVVSDSRFEVALVGAQWVLRLRAEESLNYETAHTHDLRIRATDSAGNTATKEVTVNVNAVPAFAQETYSENILRGATIGSIITNVAATDAEGDDLTYSIIAGNDAGLFDIDGQGNILLAVPDEEIKPATHRLKIIATDTAGNTDTASVRIIDYAARGTDGDDGLTSYYAEEARVIYGYGGDDRLSSYSRSATTIHGGSGDDRLSGSSWNDTLYGDSGNDYLYGEDGEDDLYGNDGDDTLYGGADDDAIFGHSGDDALYGGSGDDYLDGGSGTNLLYGGADADVFNLNEREWGRIYFRPVTTDIVVDFSSADGDHLVLRNRVIPVQGTFNPSSIKDLETDGGLRFDTSGNRVIKGHESGENDADIHDTVIYIGDTIIAVLEDFTDLTPGMIYFAVTGSNDDDIIHGSDGGNKIKGKGGDDTIYGGASDDLIYGSYGDDTIHGGDGDDTIYGDDLIYYGSYGDDTIHGGDGDDIIYGGAGTNQINGDGGDDFLAGGNDNDQINGGAGDDKLYGNSGNDVLYGGAGDDFLVGHYGADIFVLDADDAGVDIVGDFSVFYYSDYSDKIRIASVESSTPITSLEELYDIANLRVEKGHITRPNYDTTRDDKSIENTAIYMDDALVMVLEDFDADPTLDMFDLPNVTANQAPVFAQESYSVDIARGAEIGDIITNIAATDADGDTLTYAITAGNDVGLFIVDATNGDIKLTVPDARTDPTAYTLTLTATDTSGNIDTTTVTITDYAMRGTDGRDTFHGTDGADTIYGLGGRDYIMGNHGDDTLHGGEEDDILHGGAGDNTLYGDKGDDILYGGAEVDILYGGSGDDTLDSGGGDDTLYGGDGDDNLISWDGDDTLYGEDGDDTLIGYWGDDTLYGGSGNDRFYGDNGNDTLDGGAGDDYLWGGAGADIFVLDAGSATVSDFTPGDGDKIRVAEFTGVIPEGIEAFLTAANLRVEKGHISVDGLNSDSDRATEKNIAIYHGDKLVIVLEDFDADLTLNMFDLPNATANQAPVFAQESYSVDIARGAEIGDIITNIAATDADGDTLTYAITAGNDVGLFIVDATNGDIKLTVPDARTDPTAYTLTLTATDTSGNIDTTTVTVTDYAMRGTDGRDTFHGTDGADTIYGLGGRDYIMGNHGDDTLHGGEEDDILHGGAGDNTLYGDKGDDILYGGAEVDILYGGSGDDTLDSGGGDDTLYGGDGDDNLISWDGDDTLYGEDGDDTLIGYWGDDTLYGGSGNDRFYGDNGNDTLDGGAGDDYLWGGAGADIFVLDAGSATVSDFTPGDGDKIRVAEFTGVIPEGIEAFLTAANLRVEKGHISVDGLNSDSDRATEKNTAIYHGDKLVMVLEDFDADLTLNMFDLPNATANQAPVFAQESYSVDIARGAEIGDIITNIAATDADGDTLTYAITAGNDVGLFIVDATNGDIKLTVPDARTDPTAYTLTLTATDTSGNIGTTTVTITDYAMRGTDGRDTFHGTDGADTIYGLGGRDYIMGNHGADTLHGGEEDDILHGGAGDNTLYGDKGDDILYGGAEVDILYGGSGDDTLDSGGGDDTLYGGDGDDNLISWDGDDTLYGEDGDDTLIGYWGDDTLYGGSGNDRFYGDNGNDTLDGGAGDDYLWGGAGADIFVLGAGSATVSDFTLGDGDKIRVAEFTGVIPEGIEAFLTAANLRVEKGHISVDGLNSDSDRATEKNTAIYHGDKLVMVLEDFDADLTLNMFDLPNVTASQAPVFAQRTHTATLAEDATIDSAVVTVQATDADAGDTLTYSIVGGDDNGSFAINDNGEITLTGALDYETATSHTISVQVEDEAGLTDTAEVTISLIDIDHAPVFAQESYSVDIARGAEIGDIITNIAATDADGDTLTYAITAGNDNGLFDIDGQGNITLAIPNTRTDAGDHTLTITATDTAGNTDTATVTITDYAIRGVNDLSRWVGDRIYGAGGEDIIYGYSGGDWIDGKDGDDILYGGDDHDHILGDAGNDKLYGGGGYDTLWGDAGRDMLYGGADRDRFHVNVADASANETDVIVDFSADERDGLILRISVDDTFQASSLELLATTGGIRFDTSGNKIIKGHESGENDSEINDTVIYKGDVVVAVLEDFTGLTINMLDLEIIGFNGDDTIHGASGNDYLTGKGGDDTLYGGNGNDTLYGDFAYLPSDGDAGDDILYGGGGGDNLRGGAGRDMLYGGAGRDHLDGGDGDDTLYGEEGHDTLYGDRFGGEGDDTLYGDEGEDELYGNRGDDTLYGGDDRDRLDGGTGADTLYGGDDRDRLDGGTGADTLYGGDERDWLYGGSGADTLYGGAHNDYLTGDGGADIFVLNTAEADSGADTITDFTPGDGDKIRVDDFTGVIHGSVEAFLTAANLRVEKTRSHDE